MSLKERILVHLEEHSNALFKTKNKIREIELIALSLINTLENKGTIYWCGNGGSAADAQHLAAELVGRFKFERPPISSIALTTDTSVITSIGNDYGFSEVFARQVSGLINKDDVLVVLSTSGNSPNILEAVKAAKAKSIKTIGLLGKSGGKVKDLLDQYLIIESNGTDIIQELHITIGHIMIDLIENQLSSR